MLIATNLWGLTIGQALFPGVYCNTLILVTAWWRRYCCNFILRWGNWARKVESLAQRDRASEGRAGVPLPTSLTAYSLSKMCLNLDIGVCWKITRAPSDLAVTTQWGSLIPFGPMWQAGQLPLLTVWDLFLFLREPLTHRAYFVLRFGGPFCFTDPEGISRLMLRQKLFLSDQPWIVRTAFSHNPGLPLK